MARSDTSTLSVRIPTSLVERLKVAAQQRHTTVTRVVHEALEQSVRIDDNDRADVGLQDIIGCVSGVRTNSRDVRTTITEYLESKRNLGRL